MNTTRTFYKTTVTVNYNGNETKVVSSGRKVIGGEPKDTTYKFSSYDDLVANAGIQEGFIIAANNDNSAVTIAVNKSKNPVILKNGFESLEITVSYEPDVDFLMKPAKALTVGDIVDLINA